MCDALVDDGPQTADDGRPLVTARRADRASAVLEEMERANLFLFPLDNRREWYRYHHLFAELLRERLRRSTPEASIIKLHHRASSWFRHSGLPVEAVAHARQAGDPGLAASLLEEQLPFFFGGGDLSTLAELGSSLSGDELARRPTLAMALGCASLITGRLSDSARRMLGRDRSQEVALPRQIAMYLLREESNISLPQIGEVLGGRDHTTVMYGCEKINDLLERDDRLRRRVVEIREHIYKQSPLQF